MAVRIGVVADKGGVGRTDLVRMLAEQYARLGLSVLSVDMDYQAILSRRLGIKMYGADKDLPSTSLLMQPDVRSGQAAELRIPCRWATESAQRISVIPASRELWEIEEMPSRGNPTGRLERSLEGADDEDHVTLFDTRPDMGKASQSVWATCDFLLGVTPANTDGAEGLLRLLVEALAYAADLGNPKLKIAGVVLNEYNPRAKWNVSNMDKLRRGLSSSAFPNEIPILDKTIPRRTYIEQSANDGVPLEVQLAGNTLDAEKKREEVNAFLKPLAKQILEVTNVIEARS